jgi:putative ABC transport system ATP-binding protein
VKWAFRWLLLLVKEVVQLLEGLNEKGMILLLVTHDQELGSRASRQIRMIDGRIAGEGLGT